MSNAELPTWQVKQKLHQICETSKNRYYTKDYTYYRKTEGTIKYDTQITINHPAKKT